MKKILVLFILPVWLLATAGEIFPAPEPLPGEQETFEKAKLLIFDENWSAALKQLEVLGQKFPQGAYRSASLFYRGKCLAELGQLKAALQAYENYLASGEKTGLSEEAQISIIDLSFKLYQKGEADSFQKILSFLASPVKVIRYYAAFKLSYLADKGKAAAALPVLKKIAAEESDTELKDRAKIAILRIDPAAAKGIGSSAPASDARVLKIEVKKKGEKGPSLKLTLPLALADLALRALDEDQKWSLKQKGYDLEEIIRTISTKKGTILEFSEEGEWIRIWIE